MKYQIKGNYFNSKYHTLSQKDKADVPQIITRHCPANLDEILWELPVTYQQVDSITQSAEAGFQTWRKTSIEERINCLKRFQEQLVVKNKEIAEAISLETGKPLWESNTEAQALISKVNITISESLKRIETKEINEIMPNTKGTINYQPIGPCLIIGPFNFPCHLANGQIVNALIAGNSIVFKPSEKTSYSGQLLIDCFHEANFPEGVINLIQGGGEAASRFVREKSIKGVFFTGSKEVGQKILEVTHKDLSKLVALELGGKNTSIIHSDALLAPALTELIKACFMTSGQRCVSTSLVPIHEKVADEFIEKFHQLSKKIIIDHPIDYKEEPLMGPLIDQLSVDNYLNFMGMAKREGIEELMRGKKIEKEFKGHYVSPSIHLAKISQISQSHFLTSELFGPNCTFIQYSDIEEAIHIANSNEYGLAASIFTQDRSLFDHTRNEIICGQFNLNKTTVGSSSSLPFGGVKSSGNYRPAAVSFIDSCTYPQSSLEIDNLEDTATEVKGIAD